MHGIKTYNAIFLKQNKRNNEEIWPNKSRTKVNNLGVEKTRGYRPDNKNGIYVSKGTEAK